MRMILITIYPLDYLTTYANSYIANQLDSQARGMGVGAFSVAVFCYPTWSSPNFSKLFIRALFLVYVDCLDSYDSNHDDVHQNGIYSPNNALDF